MAKLTSHFSPWFIAGAVLVSGVAAAYVLPGWAVLRHTAEHREELHLSTLRADGAMTFFAAAASDAGAAGLANPDGLSEASLSIKSSGRCRLEVGQGEGAKSAWVWSHGQARVEGKDLAFLGVALEHVCVLISESADRSELERYLAKLKVDTRVSSLDRLNHDVAYVLGNPGATEPQVWFFKEFFAPARVRFVDAQGTAWDVKMLDYGSPQGGSTFPRVIEVLKSGELLARFTTARTDVRAVLPDRLF